MGSSPGEDVDTRAVAACTRRALGYAPGMQAAQAPLSPSSPVLYLAGLSAVAFLALALATSVRRGSHPLAFDLGVMCVTMSAYNILEVAYSLSGDPSWAFLEYAAASSCAIPTLRLFIGYVGQRRRHRRLLGAATVYFAAVAVTCLLPFAVPAWAGFPGGTAWALLMLAGMAPSFGWAGFLLWRYAHRSHREERARVVLLGGALLLGVGGVTTDLVSIAGGVAPRLSALGLVVASGLVAALMLRARVFEQVRVVRFASAVLAATLAVIAQLAVVTWLGRSVALLAVGTAVVVMTLIAAMRPLYATLGEERARLEESATLGRFAGQMAHDLRNPLAAISGAAQFLLEEHRQGRPLEPHVEFVALVLDRAERIERVVADYQRLGRVDPALSEHDVNALVGEAVASHRAALPASVSFAVELSEGLPRCRLDRDLFVHALENVLRNAVEALEGSGTIGVQTKATADARRVAVTITDDGPGMDPRVAERAFDAFFTTKAAGTGLGLAFAAKVLEAHGGTARLSSRLGAGTSIELALPVDA